MNMEQVKEALDQYHAGGAGFELREALREAGVSEGLAEQAMGRAIQARGEWDPNHLIRRDEATAALDEHYDGGTVDDLRKALRVAGFGEGLIIQAVERALTSHLGRIPLIYHGLKCPSCGEQRKSRLEEHGGSPSVIACLSCGVRYTADIDEDGDCCVRQVPVGIEYSCPKCGKIILDGLDTCGSCSFESGGLAV